jgi:hypothetical protein
MQVEQLIPGLRCNNTSIIQHFKKCFRTLSREELWSHYCTAQEPIWTLVEIKSLEKVRLNYLIVVCKSRLLESQQLLILEYVNTILEKSTLPYNSVKSIMASVRRYVLLILRIYSPIDLFPRSLKISILSFTWHPEFTFKVF